MSTKTSNQLEIVLFLCGVIPLKLHQKMIESTSQLGATSFYSSYLTASRP